MIDEALLEETDSLDSQEYSLSKSGSLLTDGKKGIIHPKIFSSITFFNTWREQKRVLNFPVPLEEQYFSIIFNISEIAIIFKNRRAMIVLNIPLLAEKLYNLIRAVPVPEMGWFYNSLIIPNDYLIILGQAQTMFIPTSETELLNMKNLGKFSTLKRTHPDYST